MLSSGARFLRATLLHFGGSHRQGLSKWTLHCGQANSLHLQYHISLVLRCGMLYTVALILRRGNNEYGDMIRLGYPSVCHTSLPSV